MNEHKHEEHSTLEVDDSRLPEIEHDQHLPEALFPNEYPKVADDYPNAAPPPPETAKRATICGLRRRTFWIVIAIVFIVVEAAVVGGAVGGTRGSRPANSSSTTTASTATPTTTTTPASKPTPSNRLSLNSKLSSLYFTDANNVDHYWVYFQISTKAIYQSAWNSSAQIWAVSPVTSADRDVKDQTSIAANIYYHSSSVSITNPPSGRIEADSFSSKLTFVSSFSIRKATYRRSAVTFLQFLVMGSGSLLSMTQATASRQRARHSLYIMAVSATAVPMRIFSSTRIHKERCRNMTMGVYPLQPVCLVFLSLYLDLRSLSCQSFGVQYLGSTLAQTTSPQIRVI